MPSWLAHVPAAMGVAAMAAPPQTTRTTRRFWVTAALCGIIPDIDFLGAPFGARAYMEFFGGHRAITHGFAFAIVAGIVLARFAFRDALWDGVRVRLAIALALAMLTHGLLDAMTNNNPAVAFFSPFSAERYKSPWLPINPSGSSNARGFARLPAVLFNEFVWAGLPGLVLLYLSPAWRRRTPTARSDA